MSRNYNKVILVGHVGSAPESRSDTVATFSLATNASWKNKTSGEYDTRTDWHRITARFEVLDADAKKAPEALSEEEDFAF